MKATIETSKGTITLELDAERAPATVANFAEYAKSGFYDGTIFHRVIDGFMIQGGGFTRDMNQKDTRDPIVIESMNGLKNLRGTIAMARTMDPNSASSSSISSTTRSSTSPRRLRADTATPSSGVFSTEWRSLTRSQRSAPGRSVRTKTSRPRLWSSKK